MDRIYQMVSNMKQLYNVRLSDNQTEQLVINIYSARGDLDKVRKLLKEYFPESLVLDKTIRSKL